MDIVIFLVVATLMLWLYFAPSIIAVNRNHCNQVPIILLNLFLGWLFIPWVIAICWSTSVQRSQESENKKG